MLSAISLSFLRSLLIVFGIIKLLKGLVKAVEVELSVTHLLHLT